ncbi:MAG: DoxX family membrane protein [Candidatus Yanofskybacteria bacterium]|nr:DoxX family membrane protein [Candidatus Yanofskybacteria bacterium]
MSPRQLSAFSISGLRISIGIIFLWFGLLKFTSYNPAYDLIHASFPLLSEGGGLLFLAALETIIGIALICNWYPKVVVTVLVLHMIGTFGTFLTVPGLMFDPHFPILTMEGEFVVKNLVLATGALAVLWNSKK